MQPFPQKVKPAPSDIHLSHPRANGSLKFQFTSQFNFRRLAITITQSWDWLSAKSGAGCLQAIFDEAPLPRGDVSTTKSLPARFVSIFSPSYANSTKNVYQTTSTNKTNLERGPVYTPISFVKLLLWMGSHAINQRRRERLKIFHHLWKASPGQGSSDWNFSAFPPEAAAHSGRDKNNHLEEENRATGKLVLKSEGVCSLPKAHDSIFQIPAITWVSFLQSMFVRVAGVGKLQFWSISLIFLSENQFFFHFQGISKFKIQISGKVKSLGSDHLTESFFWTLCASLCPKEVTAQQEGPRRRGQFISFQGSRRDSSRRTNSPRGHHSAARK